MAFHGSRDTRRELQRLRVRVATTGMTRFVLPASALSIISRVNSNDSPLQSGVHTLKQDELPLHLREVPMRSVIRAAQRHMQWMHVDICRVHGCEAC